MTLFTISRIDLIDFRSDLIVGLKRPRGRIWGRVLEQPRELDIKVQMANVYVDWLFHKNTLYLVQVGSGNTILASKSSANKTQKNQECKAKINYAAEIIISKCCKLKALVASI